ncbi:MAG: hypothetical protein NZ608_06930 [candidate division WOR-3 bacterium]|nr:hypothetical protein [candidate division WOR-3 bacterium]
MRIKIPVDREVEKNGKLLMWKNKNNPFKVIVFHYTAFDDSEEFRIEKEKSFISQTTWLKEMELDFDIIQEANLVFPNFSSKNIKEIKLDKRFPILRGWDFGFLNACVLFAQKNDKNQLLVFEELICQKTYTKELAMKVLQLSEQYHGFEFLDFCDPKSITQKSEKSELTNLDILSVFNIYPQWKIINVRTGINMISMLIDKKVGDEYGLMVAPRCKSLIEGFRGGYIWENAERPAKDGYYDHIFDALRYIVVNNYTFQEIIGKEEIEIKKEDEELSPIERLVKSLKEVQEGKEDEYKIIF